MSNLVFYGLMGSGKSTAADYVAEQHGNTKLSFATPLKEIAERIWGPDAVKDGDKLQQLGVAVRDIDPDAWANMMFDNVSEHFEAGEDVVNDDTRFPNEYWGLKAMGFTFVRVIAQESIRVDRLLRNGKLQDNSQLNHVSEGQLLGLEATKAGIVPDYTIVNNYSDAEDLYRLVDSIIWQIEAEV